MTTTIDLIDLQTFVKYAHDDVWLVSTTKTDTGTASGIGWRQYRITVTARDALDDGIVYRFFTSILCQTVINGNGRPQLLSDRDRAMAKSWGELAVIIGQYLGKHNHTVKTGQIAIADDYKPIDGNLDGVADFDADSMRWRSPDAPTQSRMFPETPVGDYGRAH